MARNKRSELDKAIKRLQTNAWFGCIEQEYVIKTQASREKYNLGEIAKWIDMVVDNQNSSYETLRQIHEGRNNKVMPSENTLKIVEAVVNGSMRLFEQGPLGSALFKVLNLPDEPDVLLEVGIGLSRERMNEMMKSQRYSDIAARQYRNLNGNTLMDVLSELAPLVARWRHALATDHSINDIIRGVEDCIGKIERCAWQGRFGTSPLDPRLLRLVMDLIYAESPRAKGMPRSSIFVKEVFAQT